MGTATVAAITGATCFVVGVVAAPFIVIWLVARDEKKAEHERRLHEYGIGSDTRADVHNSRGA